MSFYGPSASDERPSTGPTAPTTGSPYGPQSRIAYPERGKLGSAQLAHLGWRLASAAIDYGVPLVVISFLGSLTSSTRTQQVCNIYGCRLETVT
jgi:hypothetical protein